VYSMNTNTLIYSQISTGISYPREIENQFRSKAKHEFVTRNRSTIFIKVQEGESSFPPIILKNHKLQ